MSFFNKSRVQKRRAASSSTPPLVRSITTPSASPSKRPPTGTPTPPRRTNSSFPTPTPRREPSSVKAEDDDDDYFLTFQLDDIGLSGALATDPSLRDVPQSLRHIRERMFDPLPSAGLSSTRISEVLRFRTRVPPIAGAGHVAAVLSAAASSRAGINNGGHRSGSHTSTEREVDELVRQGLLVRVIVPARGAAGEVLVEVAEIEKLLNRALASKSGNTSGITELIIQDFIAWVRDKHTGARMPEKGTDALIRCGFLTSHGIAGAGVNSIFARPEDRFSHVSIDAVARAASGSVAAVGGDGALDRAGGSGGGRVEDEGAAHSRLQLAVPGMGPYLKLAMGALAHLKGLLARAPFREAPEDLLRERWNGGPEGGRGGEGRMAARGEFFGALPGRTKKWKEFYGLSFDWLLAEAVATGLVELFETGSVGRGVRLVG